MLKDIPAEIAERLLRVNAIKLSPKNPFTWASGLKSPIYCDNRVSLSYPTTRDFVKNSLVEKAKSFGDFDIVAGVATAGIPHGILIADALNKPFVYVRGKAKGHGRQNMIEGDIKGDERVLVVEDLISTGMSSIQAATALRDCGCEVVSILAIFDYGFDVAKQNFKDNDFNCVAISNYGALIDEAMNSGYINEEEAVILKSWREDPKAWSEKNS